MDEEEDLDSPGDAGAGDFVATQQGQTRRHGRGSGTKVAPAQGTVEPGGASTSNTTSLEGPYPFIIMFPLDYLYIYIILSTYLS